jgi:predicted N-acetyltransferase YhbS
VKEDASVVVIKEGGRVSPLRWFAVKRLLREAFGQLRLPKIDRHYCVFEKRMLVGFAAVSDRIVLLDGEEADASLIGLVAIAKSRRGAGLGSVLLHSLVVDETERKRDLILNCGDGMKGFYIKAGFKKISDAAGYARNGRIEWDADPVLACGRIADRLCARAFLGEDF